MTVPRIYREFDDVEDRLAAMPAGRFVTPDEVAQAILFLSSEAASAISGVVLPGGRRARAGRVLGPRLRCSAPLLPGPQPGQIK